MKKQLISLMIFFCLFMGCQRSTKVTKELHTELLKNIEAYKVMTDIGDVIIAVHNNKICSAIYYSGDIKKTMILIEKEKSVRLIEAKDILEENDSIITILKYLDNK